MAKFLDENGLSHFYSLLKSKFNKVDPATANPAMDGTVAVGTSAKYAREDHVHPSDTSRAPTSHASTATTYGIGTGSSYGHVKLSDATDSASAASSGVAATPKAVSQAILAASQDAAEKYAPKSHVSAGATNTVLAHVSLSDAIDGTEAAASGYTAATPKAVADAVTAANTYSRSLLDMGIRHATCTTAAGTAEKVATTDILAETGKTGDALDVSSGTCILVTFKNGNSATTPTLRVDNSTAAPIALPNNATGGSTTGSGTTYNSWGAYETVLFTYDGARWVHLGSGYLSYQSYNLASLAAPKASPALTGTPTAPTASAGTNTTQIATTAFVSTAITNAMTGSASFKGSLGSSTSTATYTQSTLEAASYKAGWYLVVNSAGTYVGHACEVGDMVYCVKGKGSAYAASDFTVVQNEMDVLTNTEIDAIVNS